MNVSNTEFNLFLNKTNKFEKEVCIQKDRWSINIAHTKRGFVGFLKKKIIVLWWRCLDRWKKNGKVIQHKGESDEKHMKGNI